MARKRFLRITLFDADIGGIIFICIRYTGYIVRYPEPIRKQGNLKSTDFICDMPVPRNSIRCRGKKIDVSLLHHIGNHIIGNNGGVKPHIGGAACG